MKKIIKFVVYSFLGLIGTGIVFIGFILMRAELSKTELVCNGTGVGVYKGEEYREEVDLTVVIEPYAFSGIATVTSDGMANGIFHSDFERATFWESQYKRYDELSEYHVLRLVLYTKQGNPRHQWHFAVDRRTLKFEINEQRNIGTEFEEQKEYSGSCHKQGKVI